MGEIRTTWGKLSEEDFIEIGRDREKLVLLLHNKYEGELALAENKVQQFVTRMERALNHPEAKKTNKSLSETALWRKQPRKNRVVLDTLNRTRRQQ